jgi:chromosome segregation ATPase
MLDVRRWLLGIQFLSSTSSEEQKPMTTDPYCRTRSIFATQLQKLFGCAIVLVLLVSFCGEAQAATAATNSPDDDAADNTGFKWSWEKTTGKSESNDKYEQLIKDYLQLRTEHDGLERRYQQIQKTNAELLLQVKTLQQRERKLIDSVQELKRATEQMADGAPTVSDSEALTKALNENLRLRKEAGRLRAILANLQERGPGQSDTGSVSADSDLFGQLQKTNTELQEQIQELESSRNREAETNQQLTVELQERAEDIEQMKEEMASLRDTNELLEQEKKEWRSAIEAGADLEHKVVRMGQELTEKTDLLDQANAELEALRRELTKRRGSLAEVEKNAEAFRKEQKDLYFNLAVLYAKAGMNAEAEYEFLKLLRADPDTPDIHLNLGLLYDNHLDNPRKAAKHYRRFLELAPRKRDADRVKLRLLELEMDF